MMKTKYTAKVHSGHYDLSDKKKIIFTENGFSKCIAIYDKDNLVHCSKLYHPESILMETHFKNKRFIAFPRSSNVYVELLNNEIELEQLDINKLDKEFIKILKNFNKEDIEEWLKLDRLKNLKE